MNFFEDQRRAKEQTTRLYWMFLAVVVLVSVATGYILAGLTAGAINTNSHSTHISIDRQFYYAVAIISVCTFVFIMVVSLIKTSMLKSSPSRICYSMGARQIRSNTKDLKEIQFRNIVEEMSIASGVPVPKVFILDSNGVNAFATGFDINDSAICVTSKALQIFDRDEMQGVVGHEFSHILNGDVKLNIKLVGMTAGLILIYELGARLLRGSGRSRRSKDNAAGIALGIMVVGGVGWLMAALLKSRISKQREYLADASSVQFTRNPLGIGGALKKIYANSTQGEIKHPEASSISHMFLSEGVKSWFSFSTHPPLLYRVGRIDNSFDSERFEKEELPLLKREIYKILTDDEEKLKNENKKGKRKDIHKHLSSPEEVLKYLAPAFAFLVPLKQKGMQLDSILDQMIRGKIAEFEKMNLDDKLKFLSTLAGTLKTLGQAEREQIHKKLIAAIKEDGKVSYDEFVIYVYLKYSLIEKKVPSDIKRKSKIRNYASQLLSYVYYLGKDHPADIIEKSTAIYSFALLEKKQIGYLKLIEAIEHLRYIDYGEKEKIIKVTKMLVESDNHVNDREKAIMFLVSQCIGVPTSVMKQY